jgi:hypothetical protein
MLASRSYGSFLSRTLIAKIGLIEEQPVHAPVDLNLPDADNVLPISRGCQATAVEFHRSMKHKYLRRPCCGSLTR